MRLFPLLLLLGVLTVAGCHFEPRTDASASAEVDLDNAQLVEAADAPASVNESGDPAQQPTEVDGERPEVVLYDTEWCPYCAQAREYMAAENIPHRIVDIEASQEASAEYQRMGGTGGIPLVAVGTETIEGWSAERARQMLDAAGYD